MSLIALPDEVLKLVMEFVPLKYRLTVCCFVNRKLHAAAVAGTQQIGLSGHLVNLGRQWLSHYGQHLTSLELSRFSQPLQQLPCPNLLQLSLTECSVRLGPAAGGRHRWPGVVQGCTKLTRLELLCNIMEAPEGAVLDSLSSLVRLQHLVMRPKTYPDMQSYSVAHLSSATLPRLTHLTHLAARSLSVQNLAQLGALTSLQELYFTAHDDDPDFAIGPSSVPGLVFPASLKKLNFMSKVEPGILSLIPHGLQDLLVADVHGQGPVEGPGSLLSYVGQLQHLTRLALIVDYWPPAGPAYAALIASSNLAALCLPQAKVPAGVWPHVFPATRKMPHLTLLFFDDEQEGQQAPWGPGDLSGLISCCPNLCMIVGMLLQHGSCVSELHKLTNLSRLHVEYPDSSMADLADSLASLAAITQLEHLTLKLQHQDLWMNRPSLLPLTNLTALTALDCYEEVAFDSETEFLRLKAASTPDVWLQLLQRCAAEPGCQPTVLRSLAQQLAEQKALTAQQQQQLAVQQQLGAEQGARMAALEAQVQQLMQRHIWQ